MRLTRIGTTYFQLDQNFETEDMNKKYKTSMGGMIPMKNMKKSAYVKIHTQFRPRTMEISRAGDIRGRV